MGMEQEDKQKKKRCIRHIQRGLDVLLLVFLLYLARYQWDSSKTRQKNERLREIAGQTLPQEQIENKTPIPKPVEEPEKTAEPTPVIEEAESPAEEKPTPEKEKSPAQLEFETGYEELLAINPDLKGWLCIPDTVLSFPVVQGEDNEHYLKYDFYGEADKHGTLFMDYKADMEKGEKNIIIFGHNMRDRTMFGSLRNYKEEEYFKEHSSFFLFLPDEEREYEILAVFDNDLYSRKEEPFQFFDYRKIEDEEMFEEYYKNIKEHSLYETGIEADYSDELITLCTCDYGGRDERLLIVGKWKQEDERDTVDE